MDDADAPAGPPAWFARAVGSTPASCFVDDVGGCRIHYLRWRSEPPLRTQAAAGTEPQGVVFVHGAGAHAHWWDHIAPLLATDGYDVLAPSISGHGESGERESYDEACWSDELIACCEDAGFFDASRDGPPVLVGHSLGSYSVIRVAQRIPERIGGVVLADSGVPHPMIWMAESEAAETRKGYASQRVDGPRIHPMTRECRLTLAPPQRVRHQYVLDHISAHSWTPATRDDGSEGWRWSFDPNRSAKSDFLSSVQIGTPEAVNALRTRVGIVFGEDSMIVNPPTQRYMRQMLGEHIPLVGIPDAEHHLFLDQPLAFAAVLRSMLGEWKRAAALLPDGSTLPPLSGRPSHSDFDEAKDMERLKEGRRLGPPAQRPKL